MCRSEPQTPVASTLTTASSRSISSGSGRSSSWTSPGAWKVTACMGPARYRVAAVPGAFYEPKDGGFVPSELTRVPWDPNAQHAGPPSALICRALELCEPREEMRVGRIAIDILGPVPLAPLRVEARVVRPGRSVELLSRDAVRPRRRGHAGQRLARGGRRPTAGRGRSAAARSRARRPERLLPDRH